ncbi:glutathione S-transferase family protein [Breoghania sp.]|uniref:glutathione S-transferase family protein n=1 Tax=Breoghania sp. TaxID=2065378 RepID=UPI002AA799D0|nr:glutathione S-transferase family protein [Breoghania sp.]
MLVLHSSPTSPFGRKAKLAAAELGLEGLLLVENTETVVPDEAFLRQNPLGKIPVLITEDGQALYDSRVILEYLDHRAGGGKLLPADARRFDVLTMQALADGICEASVLMTYEKRFRPEEMWHQPWLDRQEGKVSRALAVANSRPPEMGTTLDAGCIALACALGYLDLRYEGAWRKDHASLVTWLDEFSARQPAFGRTKMKP